MRLPAFPACAGTGCGEIAERDDVELLADRGHLMAQIVGLQDEWRLISLKDVIKRVAMARATIYRHTIHDHDIA